MSDLYDPDYCAGRASAERELAACTSEAARALIHLKVASFYDCVVQFGPANGTSRTRSPTDGQIGSND